MTIKEEKIQSRIFYDLVKGVIYVKEKDILLDNVNPEIVIV